MTTENGVATMGVGFFNWSDWQSWIPTFGLFGGPGYLGGHRFKVVNGEEISVDDPSTTADDNSISIEDAMKIPPALNSSGQQSKSDADRLLKNAHMLRFPHHALLRRTPSTSHAS